MRKKGMFAGCLLALALLLAGCGAGLPGGTEEGAESPEELLDGLDSDWGTKNHRWQILDDQGKEEEAETPLYTYVFWQEKTLLAGQDPKEEREYEEVIRFMIPAEGNTVTMLVLAGLENVQVPEYIDLEDLLTFRSGAPEETLEALRDPWRFA